MIPVNRPLIAEEDIEAVANALRETFISGESPPVKQMEVALANFLGTNETVAVSTGTAALDLVAEALDIKPGDHCIVPNFTIVSTVSNLLRKGATVEFIDADPITWSMNADAASTTINQQTRLVLPVHIYGMAVDMDPILEAANRFGTFVLEDAAEALGVTYRSKKCGALGHASIFSFYANKIVTGGEGGAIATNDDLLALRLRSLRNLAQSDVRFVHNEIAWNSRISGLSAALINSQIQRLPELVQRKRDIAAQYIEGFAGHPWFEVMASKVEYSTNNYWVFPILLNSDAPFAASDFQKILFKHDIDSRRFFHPMHMQPFLKNFKVILSSDYKISSMLWERGIYLPSGLGNTNSEIDRVIQTIWDLAKK